MGTWHKPERENLAASLSELSMFALVFIILGAITLVFSLTQVLLSHVDPSSSWLITAAIFAGIILLGAGLISVSQRKPLYIVFYKHSLLLRTHRLNTRVPYDQIIEIGDSLDDGPYLKLKSGQTLVLLMADFHSAATAIPQFKKLLKQANPRIRQI